MKIFISGGTTGIGYELALLYDGEGHEVAITGRDVTKLPVDFKKNYPRIHLFEVDVNNEEAMRSAVSDFAKGDLDILIANAGISMGTKGRIPDFKRWKEVFQTNVDGLLNTLAPALEVMLKNKRGHIVTLSSVAGFLGMPGAGPYSASKAAVRIFSESLAIDLKKDNISVTTICPGFIDTPLTRKNPYSMPWLMSAPKGARLIKRAIDKKKMIYIFPWQMKIVVLFLSYLPRGLFCFIMNNINRIFHFSRE